MNDDDAEQRDEIISRLRDVQNGTAKGFTLEEYLERSLAEGGPELREALERARREFQEARARGEIQIRFVELCQKCARELTPGEPCVCETGRA